MNVFVTPNKLERNGRFIDTRFDLANLNAGRMLYEQGHIDGAVYWHLEQDLSDMTKSAGRHPMPEKAVLQQLFEAAGLSYEDAIYIYDQGGAPFASRAWWMLKYAGFPHVYIVNGGFEGLVEAGFNVSTVYPSYAKTSLTIEWDESIYASRADVKDIVDGKEQATLLDARSAVRYRGEQEPIDPIAGHIPTAKNFDWELVKDGKTLAPNDTLLQKVAKEEEIVVYCGSGVTASPLYTVLTDAGYKNVRLYVGSYSDWITEHDIETGTNE